MKMSRSLLWQLIGYNMPFGFLILFTLGTIVDGNNASPDTSLNTSNINVPTTPLHSSTMWDGSTAPQNQSVLPEPTLTTSGKGLNITDKINTDVPRVTVPLVSGQQVVVTKASVTHIPTTAPVPSTKRGAIVATSANSTSSSQVIIPSQKTPRKITIGKGKASVALSTPVPWKTSADVVKEKPGQASSGTKGPIKETGPGQTKETTKTPPVHHAVTTHDPSRHSPLLSTMKSTTKTTVTSSSNASSSGNSIGIILAIVSCVLVLLAIMAFLYFRRRHRSGSTNFTPGWAGKATLPDDAGLDKDVEQGEVDAREGETKRNTLVTFFGKRQSRVPSVVMEDMNVKGEKEETEQLLDKGAGGNLNPEGSEEANGKLKDTTMPSPQEASTSSKPGGGTSS